MAAALPVGFADERHAASNRPPPSIPLPWNPRAPPYKACRAGLPVPRRRLGIFPPNPSPLHQKSEREEWKKKEEVRET
jgi:hypothetical protein